jgi:predicted dienelactone hydrolase
MRLVDAASEYTPVSSRRGAKRVAQAFFLVLLGLSISGFRSCWTSSELAAVGNHAVGVHTASVLVDPERNREIPISVWYPSEGEAGAVTPEGPLAQNGPYPLIVSAHGLGDRPQSLAKLHEHMASHGFVIAAPKFPGSILTSPVQNLTNDIVEHPADISLVIDAALGLIDGLPEEISGAADPSRIGVMGISFGGLAAYIAGFDRELRDPRIRIAITMAASGGDRLAPRYFDFVERPIPLFLIHGTIDALIEFESTTESVFANANRPVHRLALAGGTHIGFTGISFASSGGQPDSFVCRFTPPIDTNDPAATVGFDYLANRRPYTGFESPSTASPPCSYGAEDAAEWMLPSRQLELTKIGILGFALSHFGDSATDRLQAHAFIRERFNMENGDAITEDKHVGRGWSGGRIARRPPPESP